MTGARTASALAEPLSPSNAAYQVLDDLLGPAPTVEPRMMFGHQCFSVAGKAFACVIDDGIALKLPEAVIARLEDPAIGPFRSGGQRMGGWVEINRPDGLGYERDAPLIELALVHNSEIAAGVGR